MFPETIETERLRLRRLHPRTVDLFEFYDICASDPGIEDVTEHMPWSPHETVQETREFLRTAKRQWDEGEAAQFVIRPREGEDGAGDIAGATALALDWDQRLATLGIWLRKRFWGRGYSGERADALLAVAFDRLDLDVVAVTHLDGNERSRRAIEKYVERHGGRYEGHLRNSATTQDGAVVDEHRYTISQAEYRA
ncbi:MAG: GNAT family N-acetyltransferase [Halobacteriaceae archaeon]